MNNSGWISGLRAFTWVLFFAIIIAGIIVGIGALGFWGFLLGLIVSALIAFLTVAKLMISLDEAEDIRAIRIALYGENADYAIATGVSVLSAEASREAQKKKDEETLKNGGWKCNGCGKVNPQYTGTCSCGNTKYQNY